MCVCVSYCNSFRNHDDKVIRGKIKLMLSMSLNPRQNMSVSIPGDVRQWWWMKASVYLWCHTVTYPLHHPYLQENKHQRQFQWVTATWNTWLSKKERMGRTVTVCIVYWHLWAFVQFGAAQSSLRRLLGLVECSTKCHSTFQKNETPDYTPPPNSITPIWLFLFGLTV